MYNTEGALTEITKYYNGLKEGEAQLFYPNGQLEIKGQFIGDKQDGLFTTYYKDGTLKSEIRWSEGFMEGESVEYDSLGIKIGWGTYLNGSKTEDWRYQED
jgi:antitoxin component YwqK of YwqJK toxin-antitoxin module